MTNEEFYSAIKVAELLGIDQTTVSLWVRNGDLRAEKLNPNRRNSPYRIPKSEVDRILELRKTGGKATAQG